MHTHTPAHMPAFMYECVHIHTGKQNHTQVNMQNTNKLQKKEEGAIMQYQLSICPDERTDRKLISLMKPGT